MRQENTERSAGSPSFGGTADGAALKPASCICYHSRPSHAAEFDACIGSGARQAGSRTHYRTELATVLT